MYFDSLMILTCRIGMILILGHIRTLWEGTFHIPDSNSDKKEAEGTCPDVRLDRRYHGIEGNRYPLPNDEEEIIRLENLHYMFRGLLGRNILAPISARPSGILDVGTGSGRWVVDVATEFNTARVTGGGFISNLASMQSPPEL
jgi:hypothetical protein